MIWSRNSLSLVLIKLVSVRLTLLDQSGTTKVTKTVEQLKNKMELYSNTVQNAIWESIRKPIVLERSGREPQLDDREREGERDGRWSWDGVCRSIQRTHIASVCCCVQLIIIMYVCLPLIVFATVTVRNYVALSLHKTPIQYFSTTTSTAMMLRQ